MPRTRSHTKDQLIHASMDQFWRHGYEATSVDDLVRVTGVSRHGIYSDCGGKHALYLDTFAAYQDIVVSPAFSRVEAEGAGMADIAAYLDAQIALAETSGLPGPGCLVANAMTETAPHDHQVQVMVDAHNARLKTGYLNALLSEGAHLPETTRDALADFLVTSGQGLWSMSRAVKTAAPLRQFAETLISLISIRLAK